jgi:hypothetical protein
MTRPNLQRLRAKFEAPMGTGFLTQQLREELNVELSRLSGKKWMPWTMIIAGAAFLVNSYLGNDEAPNQILGTVCLITIIVGGFWAWHIHKEMNRIIRRLAEDDRARIG